MNGKIKVRFITRHSDETTKMKVITLRYENDDFKDVLTRKYRYILNHK